MGTFKNDMDHLANLCHSSSTGLANAHIALRRKHVCIHIPADAAASSTRTGYALCKLPKDIRCVDARLCPQGALTASDTVYATITIGTNDGAGGSVTALGLIETKVTGGTGNWTAGQAVAFATITIDDTASADTYLCISHAKASTGTQVPAYNIDLNFDYD